MRLPGLLEYSMRISLGQAIARLLRVPQSRSPAETTTQKVVQKTVTKSDNAMKERAVRLNPCPLQPNTESKIRDGEIQTVLDFLA